LNCPVAIFDAKKEHSVGVRAGLAGVVVPTAGCVIKHLDNHVAAAGGELAAGLKGEVAGELVPPGVQVCLALPIEQDLDRPPAKVVAGLP
jgi:hypothetical protein